jgi:predicted tellurium resistance membrane protein TerC
LLTLTVMKTVLGIDNLIFIAVLVERLPPDQRDRGQRIGIGLALVTRLALLSVLSWVIGLTTPLFTVFDHAVSTRDAILTCGGLFLLTKATREIHEGMEAPKRPGLPKGNTPPLAPSLCKSPCSTLFSQLIQ